jgi:hypothetical protein
MFQARFYGAPENTGSRTYLAEIAEKGDLAKSLIN